MVDHENQARETGEPPQPKRTRRFPLVPLHVRVDGREYAVPGRVEDNSDGDLLITTFGLNSETPVATSRLPTRADLQRVGDSLSVYERMAEGFESHGVARAPDPDGLLAALRQPGRQRQQRTPGALRKRNTHVGPTHLRWVAEVVRSARAEGRRATTRAVAEAAEIADEPEGIDKAQRWVDAARKRRDPDTGSPYLE